MLSSYAMNAYVNRYASRGSTVFGACGHRVMTADEWEFAAQVGMKRIVAPSDSYSRDQVTGSNDCGVEEDVQY